jgi:PAS domain-containing protein
MGARVSRVTGTATWWITGRELERVSGVRIYLIAVQRMPYCCVCPSVLRWARLNQGGLMPTTQTTNLATPFSRIVDAHQISPAEIDALIEHLPVGVMVGDRDGRAVYMNETARSLRIERLDPFQWAITRALLTEDVVREEEIQVAPLGEPRRYLSAYVAPVRVPGVGVNAAFVVLADVTARTRMNAWTPMIESLVNL